MFKRILYWSWFRGSTGINSPPFKMKIPGSGSLDLFNIATNLVIGCDTTDAANPEKSVFQVKMTFGPMFSLTMPGEKRMLAHFKILHAVVTNISGFTFPHYASCKKLEFTMATNQGHRKVS
jgi:hypothetical protein